MMEKKLLEWFQLTRTWRERRREMLSSIRSSTGGEWVTTSTDASTKRSQPVFMICRMFEKPEKITVRQKYWSVNACRIYEKSRVISVHKNPGNGRGRENPRTRAQWGFSRLTQLKERGPPSLYSTFIYVPTYLRWRGCVAVPSDLWRTMPWQGRALPRSWPPSCTPRRGRTGGCWMTLSSGSAVRRPSKWKPISTSSSRGRSLKAGC